MIVAPSIFLTHEASFLWYCLFSELVKFIFMVVQQCFYDIPESNIANTNIKNIENDAPKYCKDNSDVCPLIIEMIEVIKPIQAINREGKQ